MTMTFRSSAATTVVLAAVGGLLGCGAGDPPHAPDLDVAQITAQTSDFQRELLADGLVTYAEYERATLAAMECVQNEGIVVEGPEPRDGDPRFLRYYMQVEGVDHERASALIEAASDTCDAEFSRDVSRVWEYQNLLTPAQRAEQRMLVIECLRAAGVAVDDTATDEDVFAAFMEAGQAREEAVLECGRRYPDYFVVGVK